MCNASQHEELIFATSVFGPTRKGVYQEGHLVEHRKTFVLWSHHSPVSFRCRNNTPPSCKWRESQFEPSLGTFVCLLN